MPVGEFIAEIGLRFVLEVVFYGIFYWIGFAVIKAASFGSARLAPLSTIEEKNRRKKGRKVDWSIWLHRPMQGKMLKAEAVCFVGMIVCGLIGYIVYLTVT
jgi:hypothetical protein